MSQQLKFAKRYHAVKESLQGLIELELERAVQKQRIASEHVASYSERTKQAVVSRNGSTSIHDWQTWHRYIAALEQTKQVYVEASHRAEQEVLEHREALHVAHIEKKRWETLVTQQQAKVDAELRTKEQRDADERAMLRFGRDGE